MKRHGILTVEESVIYDLLDGGNYKAHEIQENTGLPMKRCKEIETLFNAICAKHDGNIPASALDAVEVNLLGNFCLVCGDAFGKRSIDGGRCVSCDSMITGVTTEQLKREFDGLANEKKLKVLTGIQERLARRVLG